MNDILLLKYNKVTNDAFAKFAAKTSSNVRWVDLNSFGIRHDILDYPTVARFLDSFKPIESIMVGDNVKLTIMGVQGGQVRVSIEADKKIPVHRLEIWERIQREKGND